MFTQDSIRFTLQEKNLSLTKHLDVKGNNDKVRPVISHRIATPIGIVVGKRHVWFGPLTMNRMASREVHHFALGGWASKRDSISFDVGDLL